jgi:UDP-N-acetylglucosamine diphosphorylase / glucose-1-phosphate thymidylyltransferase / UDP-N-acetylgalactosamine diphosphorylase / glucosamine-1-phosphate N-acetyltransferase / galactosamine-1-phosphate N-acetyltransferase
MRVCLFEDGGVFSLDPLTATRPAFDLVCGATSLAARQCRHFAPCAVGALVRPHLAELFRLEHPETPVNDPTWLRAAPTVLVNGRWLPPVRPATSAPGPCVAVVGDTVAYAVVGPDLLTYCSQDTLEDCLSLWKDTLPHRPAGGALISYPWDLVEHNPAQLHADFDRIASSALPEAHPAQLTVVGPRTQLVVDPTARLDPLVVIDTTGGPVVIDREAVVTAFTRLEGPCYIGPEAHVLGAKIRAGSTIGPCCRVGGEVEASILHAHSNKYHDGFLGHSYVGEWVNLGAGTSNSDLRNDYGEVTVVVNGERVPTGLAKVGCFVGDHTKTALGTLINTGSNIGCFCNLVPSGPLMPKYLPSFTSWWNGGLREATDLAGLLGTATEVMRRRGAAFTEAHTNLVRHLFEETAPRRRQALKEAEQRRLRRSA